MIGHEVRWSATWMCVVGVLGCSDPNTENNGEWGAFEAENYALAGVDQNKGSRPIARAELANGNVMEIYDTGMGALVTESGEAYLGPAVSSLSNKTAADLLDLWDENVSGREAPRALVELQERLLALPRQPDSPSDRDLPDEVGGEPYATGPISNATGPMLMSPDGCGNGCCDYEWMVETFGECDSNLEAGWMYYNYGWSIRNRTEVYHYEGFVCAAIGTSTYRVELGDYGGNWSIAERHFRRWAWLAPNNFNPFDVWADEDLRSSVNTEANQHMHTYCGGRSVD